MRSRVASVRCRAVAILALTATVAAHFDQAGLYAGLVADDRIEALPSVYDESNAVHDESTAPHGLPNSTMTSGAAIVQQLLDPPSPEHGNQVGLTGFPGLNFTPRQRSRRGSNWSSPGNGLGGAGTGGGRPAFPSPETPVSLPQVGTPIVGATGTAGTTLGESSPALLSPGTSVSNPVLPSSINGSSFGFDLSVVPGGPGSGPPLFVDPPIAPGYSFSVDSGQTFASITVDTPLPNTSSLTVSFNSTTSTFDPTVLDGNGHNFDFPGGVSQFTLTGISPLDVNPNADFVTSLTFNQTGDFHLTETVLSAPEPASLVLWAMGAVGLLSARRMRGKTPRA